MAKSKEEKKKFAVPEKMKKALKFAGLILEWGVFAVLIVTFFIVLSPLLPTKKYLYTYIVATGSMEKTIAAGSVAFVKPVEPDKLKKGDIITFTSPKDQNVTVLHRIYGIKGKDKEKAFITKGDNNNAPDNWELSPALVKGTYLYSIPYIGHIGSFIKTPKGFGAIVVIPALILAFLQIRTIKQGIDEEVERRTKAALEKATGKGTKTTLKSVIILALILNGLVLYAAGGIARALFVSSATASGVTFSVKDFVPPSKPTGLKYVSPDIACGGTTDSYTVTADWDDSVANGSKTIDHYEYESYNPPTGWVWGPVNVVASQRTGSFTVGEGTYGFRVRAVDSLGYASEWSSIGFTDSCQITYDIKPIVTIDEAYGHKINGYECGIGSALSNDGLKIDITHWKSGYTLQARYKIAGGSYGSWFNLYNGIWGSGVFTVSGTNASFTILNTGNSTPGAAGWQARVLDSASNPFASIGTSEYIITTDPLSLACNGTMGHGFETAENTPLPGVGICPVYTKDKTANGGLSSTQILKWNAIDFATQYRVTGYRKDGSNWISYGTPYILLLSNPRIISSSDIVTYSTWATAEYTTAYFIEAMDGSGNLLGNTAPQNPPFTCTFTVDRTLPVSTITTPVNSGLGHTSTVNTSVIGWDGAIAGTASDTHSGVHHVELSIQRTDSGLFWNGSAWTSGTEQTVRVTSVGTTNWTYTLSDHPGGVTYVLISHAVDNAGNMENSYILVVENKIVLNPAATLILSPDKKTISFEVTDIAGYKMLDYALTYVAFDIEKGITGTGVDVSDKLNYEKKDLDLATCSSGVCTYDQNVSKFELTVTLTDKDGKTKLVKTQL